MRIPTEQAKRLDRVAFELNLHKQKLVSGLLERYLDPAVPDSLTAHGANDADALTQRRVRAQTLEPSTFTVGHHSFRPREPEVLREQEVAELLRVGLQTVLELSESGELPGRKLGGEWRFAKVAVLDWLAGACSSQTGTGRDDPDR